jgi:cytochrome c oxidase cbb3-type subunit 3
MAVNDNKSVPQSAEGTAYAGEVGMPNDELTGHEYDGIQEFDNPLPGWWKWLFVGSIIYAFPYYAYYHFGATGRSIEDQWAVAAAENARLQFAEIGELKPDKLTLVKYLNDPTWLGVGKSVYKTNCVSCHGAEGGGLVGPNLTDEHYKNVKTIEDMYRVINNGAGAGAMPAWQNRLDQNERILVAAYVASMRGTEPSGSPKGPEGNVIPAWPTVEEVQAELGTAPAGEGEATAGEAAAAEATAGGDAAAGGK